MIRSGAALTRYRPSTAPSCAIAASTACIDQGLIGLVNTDPLANFADGGREPDELGNGFTLAPEKCQDPGDLFRAHVARKHPLHKIMSFRLTQVNKVPEWQVRHASAIHSIT